jgi:hypothetical protein
MCIILHVVLLDHRGIHFTKPQNVWHRSKSKLAIASWLEGGRWLPLSLATCGLYRSLLVVKAKRGSFKNRRPIKYKNSFHFCSHLFSFKSLKQTETVPTSNTTNTVTSDSIRHNTKGYIHLSHLVSFKSKTASCLCLWVKHSWI